MGAPRIYNIDTDQFEPLPFKWEICWHCNGHGKSSAHMGAFTESELREDPEFFEDYFAGFYDRACDYCEGAGKVQVADLAKMTQAQQNALQEQAESDALYAAEVASERWLRGR